MKIWWGIFVLCMLSSYVGALEQLLQSNGLRGMSVHVCTVQTGDSCGVLARME